MIVPEDFLKLAERLLKLDNKEINKEIIYRAVISRAYYYAFHFVRENYHTHPDANFKYDHTDHEEVVNFFRRIGRTDLASIMGSLRKRRNRADYELWHNISYDQAKEYIDDVKSFIADLKSSII